MYRVEHLLLKNEHFLTVDLQKTECSGSQRPHPSAEHCSCPTPKQNPELTAEPWDSTMGGD